MTSHPSLAIVSPEDLRTLLQPLFTFPELDAF